MRTSPRTSAPCALVLALLVLPLATPPPAAAGTAEELALRYPDAEVLVLEELRDVELRIGNNDDIRSIETWRTRKRLVRDVGEHADFVYAVGALEEVVSITARTILPDGREIPVREDDIHVTSGHSGGGVFYSDLKTYRFAFPAVTKGCEVACEVVVRNDYPFVAGRWAIQGDHPKLSTEFRLAIPEVLLRGGAVWHYQIIASPDLGEPYETGRELGADSSYHRKRVYWWHVEDVPPYVREPMMPSAETRRARVRFAPGWWRDWGAPATWYRRRFFNEAVREDHQQVQALTKELLTGVVGEEARLRVLYRFARDLQYVAIELGTGGMRPSSPHVVATRGYGDCKDKATLLIALLQEAKIEALPVLVQTADDGRVDPDFVSWTFNHMIVRARTGDGRVWWLDPTASTLPAGRLPWIDQGIDALVLDEERGGLLERTPLDPMESNQIRADVYVSIPPEGSAHARVALRFSGWEAARQRYALEDGSASELEDHCRAFVRAEVLPGNVTNCAVTEPDGEDGELRLSFEVPLEAFVREQTGLRIVEPEVLVVLDGMPDLLERERTHAVELPYAKRFVTSLTMEYPADRVGLRSLPEDVVVRSHSMEFSRRARDYGDGTATVRTEFELRRPYFPHGEWPAEHDFLREVRRSRSAGLVLEESS